MEKNRKKKLKSWHALSVEEVLKSFNISKNHGLSEKQVQESFSKYGLNVLAQAKTDGIIKRFLVQFHNLLIYVLIVAAVITSLMQHWIDTFVILAVVIANSLIGFFQEGKARKAMEALRSMLSSNATVLRDGKKVVISSKEVLPGDIVFIEAGDKICADLRLISVKGLKIQEATLTGESVPIEKNVDKVSSNSAIGDRFCMAYTGTFVVDGQALGVVVATGDYTEIGHISTMIASVESVKTPLIQSMDIFAKWLTIAIIFLASLVFFIAYFLRELSLSESFMSAVALCVAAIPEGLPAILTITLAIGVQKMGARNAIIRKLPAVETLGSVSIICSDKTGTLTRNEMMLKSIMTSDGTFSLTGVGNDLDGRFIFEGLEINPHDYSLLIQSLSAASVCGEAQVQVTNDEAQIVGDPMEGALIIGAMKAKLEPKDLLVNYPRIDHIPFSSDLKLMATSHKVLENNNLNSSHGVIFLKGAPEKIIDLCKNVLTSKGESPLNPNQWYKKIDKLAGQGERVLAVAQANISNVDTELNLEGLEGIDISLLGLFGFIDPPRTEAIESIKECKSAGINVKMITGDHVATAKSIGEQLGISNFENALTGSDIDNLSDSSLKEKVLETDIFARTSPEHKLRIVKALQTHRHIVAMTGDGVNDAPALKQADVGVAMGKKGTESAKEVSEIVLADDNFASITQAVKEGRTVYDNLKKAITFLLPINGGESGTIIFAIILGLQLPITPLQILWVNMVSSVTLALALSFEPPEKNIMSRPPRDINKNVLDGFLVWRIGFVSILFLIGIFGVYSWSISIGHDIAYARTHAVNALVVMEVFYLLSVRTILPPKFSIRELIGTKAILISCFIVLGLQFIFNYAPFMNAFFDSRAMGFYEGFIILLLGVIFYFILYIEKYLSSRGQHPASNPCNRLA